MSLAAIHAQLTDRLGIDPSTLSRTGTDGVIRRRMQATGATTLDAYARHVGRERCEFEELAGALLVHETSFFRYPASFGLLAGDARDKLRATAAATYRVHCAACATGEEPASAAMTLLEAGVDPARLRIEATDISPSALARARAGRYRAKTLRSVLPRLRERYFEPDGDEWRLVPAIRERIRYRQANAIEPGYGTDETPYDAVFCRNLLIYLVPEARRRVLTTVLGMLRTDGLMFVGHAEVAAVRERGLSSARPSEAFACRKVPASSRPADVVVSSSSARSPGVPVTAPPAPEPAPARDPLARAVALADAGRLDDAQRLLDARMAAGTPTANDYHLLGVIESARSRSAASEEALVKALYLDPAHYPSLLQLALLMDERGEGVRADRLRQKARRVHADWRATNGDSAREEDAHGEA